MAAAAATPRLLVVIGCTGAGKTNLAIALAKRCNGELISCDSIQVYEGLPIASNQCTLEEAGGVRQHCMAVVPPWKAMHVHDFRRAAKALIADIHSRGNTVVIVGGTFYWLESILFQTFLSRETENSPADAPESHGEVDEQMQDDDDQAQLLADAPLSSEQLLKLDTASIASLPLPHLAFAATTLLSKRHPPPNSESAQQALLQHLGATLTSDEWKSALEAMSMVGVKSVHFVRRILQAHASTAMPSIAGTAAADSTPALSTAVASSSPSSLFPSPHLFALLCLLDPVTAYKLHPNNVRKIHRSLEIFVESGGRKVQSEINQETGGAKGMGGLQYPVQAVWLDCQQDVLDQRLDRRIDQMMQRGLLKEAEDMYLRLWKRQTRMDAASSNSVKDQDATMEDAAASEWRYNNPIDPDCRICADVESRDIEVLPPAAASISAAPSADPSSSFSSYLGPTPLRFDWERGTGQALGFKEFRPYFQMKFHTAPSSSATEGSESKQEEATNDAQQAEPPTKKQKVSASKAVTSSSSSDEAFSACLAKCIESLKVKTRAYAKVQARWIRNRLWSDSATETASDSDDAAHLPILRLDATVVDAATWATQIEAPAVEVCEGFLAGKQVDLKAYAKFSEKLPPVARSSHVASAASAAVTAESLSGAWTKQECSDCGVICTGQREWTKHLGSKKHRARSTADSRRRQQMAQQEAVQKARQAKKEAAVAIAAAAAASDSGSDMKQ
jgi:tRNA A37 N6-isopentenylltransferase MiaA